ncbi:hypothetical protein Gohar_003435 [Gossypium harknessii]|uniref:Uncharacterized protein n=1 Tax=Gossypium harknessii TaxID=34285 RepID=A0A7J9HNX9_9ROSI|nr:hypothetical protein [Gossypium harknessii]
MESLDLSYNNLIGNIPAKFADWTIGSIDENSYVGNPFFCGSLVGKNCSPVTTPLTRKASSGIKEDHGFIDMNAFYASFFAC